MTTPELSARERISPMVIRVMIFGSIAAFYLYYIGGCLIGRFIPRQLEPAQSVGDAAEPDEQTLFFWGEPEAGVKLLFEIGGNEASIPDPEEDPWNRVLGLEDDPHRYYPLHVIHFRGPDPVVVSPEDGIVELVTSSGRRIPSRSLRRLVDRDAVSDSAWLQVQACSPETDVEVRPGLRYRLLLAFPSRDLEGEEIRDVIVNWEGRAIPLVVRSTENGDLARFVMQPRETLPPAWGGSPEDRTGEPPEAASSLSSPTRDPLDLKKQ